LKVIGLKLLQRRSRSSNYLMFLIRRYSKLRDVQRVVVNWTFQAFISCANTHTTRGTSIPIPEAKADDQGVYPILNPNVFCAHVSIPSFVKLGVIRRDWQIDMTCSLQKYMRLKMDLGSWLVRLDVGSWAGNQKPCRPCVVNDAESKMSSLLRSHYDIFIDIQ